MTGKISVFIHSPPNFGVGAMKAKNMVQLINS